MRDVSKGDTCFGCNTYGSRRFAPHYLSRAEPRDDTLFDLSPEFNVRDLAARQRLRSLRIACNTFSSEYACRTRSSRHARRCQYNTRRITCAAARLFDGHWGEWLASFSCAPSAPPFIESNPAACLPLCRDRPLEGSPRAVTRPLPRDADRLPSRLWVRKCIWPTILPDHPIISSELLIL